MLSDANRKTFATTTSKTSQCTFWCSVLSDDELTPEQAKQLSVSMHLLVLSAFRPGLSEPRRRPPASSQCTFWCSVPSDLNGDALDEYLIMVSMHLLVLSAFRRTRRFRFWLGRFLSQCTFWCSVLSDTQFAIGELALKVSMHLLVLSAFRPFSSLYGLSLTGLNAPSGAQCFPTIKLLNFSSTNGLRLNAPSGAQCFPTGFCEYVCVD